ncbi:cystatin-A1-like [Leptodactylus fuscus]|uniref:cystatin-A1-like n=1 Tax=Leptodactylus fuscus TaxID=238119 RepID=UPI003F4E4E7F
MAAIQYMLLFLLVIVPEHWTYEDVKQQQLIGGLGEEHQANAEIQGYCRSVRARFLKQSQTNARKFKAITYRSQVVAGTNYFVKVWLGGDEYCHLRIFKPLPYTGLRPSLSNFQCGKTKEEAIEYF